MAAPGGLAAFSLAVQSGLCRRVQTVLDWHLSHSPVMFVAPVRVELNTPLMGTIQNPTRTALVCARWVLLSHHLHLAPQRDLHQNPKVNVVSLRTLEN